MNDAKRRAKDAENAFVAMLMSEATDAEVAEGLNSVFSTNTKLLRTYTPSRVHHDHVSFKDRDEYRFFFNDLVEKVLLRKRTGETAYIICGYIRNAAERINVDVFETHSMPPTMHEKPQLVLVS